MPLQATSGAASYDGFGGGVAAVPNFIEDVFSCFLYTGNGSTQTITNGIDLSTKGGLVWTKIRSSASFGHSLIDTARGLSSNLATEIADGAYTSFTRITSFNTTGYALGANSYQNENASTFVSWTFRKQPKFFDVVTYTGTGSNTTIAHSLGSVPGSIIVKRTDTTADWAVYHRSLANTEYLVLNSTAAKATGATWWNSTTPTSTVFSLGTDASVNASGGTYVAYVFAHDAGGFGLTGTDNVISCGSFTGTSNVNLGYEPQWILLKRSDGVNDWWIFDTMRGWLAGSDTASVLRPNLSNAELSTGFDTKITSTGFTTALTGSYIYIAIRRGPMKVPTLGTSVFSPIAYTGNSVGNTTVQNLTTSFSGDTVIIQQRNTLGNAPLAFDKLRGSTQGLYTSRTSAEENIAATRAGQSVGFNNTQTVLTGQFTDFGNYNYLSDTFVGWNFKRAPSFFDEVCYTGPGTVMTVNHNLQVVPELMIVKPRSASGDWIVYSSTLGATAGLYLNLPNNKYFNSSNWNDTSPTSSVFTVGANGDTNFGNRTYVAYLFATCAGVSKVGSYTGTGTTKQIDCGFTAGARFVLIKRTDSTGDWYVWDTARGIVAGNDPYLLLNSTAAEVTSTDYIDTYSAGFEISSTAPAAINASAGTFVFLAIA
jgi:hypothetical protein